MKRNTTILIALLISIAVSASAEVVVSVQREVAVNSKVLTVGDIATFSGGDSSSIESISKVRLGFSPMPGSWRELDRDLIQDQLSINGFSAMNVKLQAPSVVRIFRRSQTVDGAMLQNRVRDYILTNAPWNTEEMVISSLSNPGSVAVAEGNLSMEIDPRGDGNFLGNETYIVEIYVDGVKANRVLLQANIRVVRDTLVAARGINPRQLLSESDMEIRRIDISTSRGDASLTLDEAVGMASRAYIRPGQVITRNNVMMPILVKRGQVVSLDARSNGFSIQTRGVAQQDGRKGDIIRVINPSSKKVIEALVVGPQKTEVIF